VKKSSADGEGRTPPADLRRRAEEQYAAPPEGDAPEPVAALLHELRVHQIELEMQNEELRGAHLEAREQRAKYFTLFEHAPVGYLTLSDKGIVGEANITAGHLLSVNPRELVGLPLSAFIFAADQRAYFRHLELLKQTEAPQSCELRLQPVGAEPLWARLESRPQRAAGDDPSRYRVTFTDVHKRVLAEQALRLKSEEVARQQELLATLLDAIPSPVFYKDTAGAYLGCNRAFELFLGRERSEIIGKTATDLGPAEIAERYDAMDRRLLEQSGTQIYEWPVKAADGSLHDVVFNKATFNGSDGQVAGLIGVMLDVTARKRSEEALKESELNLRAVFDTVDDIVVVSTPDGRLVYANPAASLRLDYGAAEIAGMQMLDLYPAESRGEAAAVFAGISWGGQESCSLPLQSKSGSLVLVETRVWLGRWDGAQCVFAVSKDLIKEQEALQKFDWLFRSNPALTAVSSLPGGRFTEVNDAFLNALGYSLEEVLGYTTDELDLFIDPAEQRAMGDQLRAQGRVSNCELKIRCKDGAILDGIFSGEIVESQGKQYFLTAMIDQTERKRAEEALLRSEHALQSALDGLAASIVVLDDRGTILLVNKRWREFAEQNGLAADAVSEGANYLEVCDAAAGQDSAEAARFAAGIRAVLAAETDSYTLAYPCDSPGEKRWFTGRVTLLPSEGAPRVVVAHEDITVRKRAEEVLQESELNFHAFFDAVDDIIVVGTPEGRLVYANPAASAKLGLSAAELAAMRVLDLYPADERGEAEAVFAALLSGERESCPLPLQSKSGELIQVETRAWRGHWNGAECIFGVSKDLTREQVALRFAEVQAELNKRMLAEETLVRSARELHEQLLDTMKTMGAIVGLRDPYTAAHERRVTELAVAIAVEMGLGEEAIEGLAFAGEVHDIGKIGVPAEILSKPAALNEEEYALIRRHPQAGRELLSAIRFRQPVAEIVGQHQERFDGSGYPDGLKGEEIMLEARILAVADVVEAMASHRPYRAGLGLDAALAEVHAGAGVRYDADAVAACERVFAQGFVFREA